MAEVKTNKAVYPYKGKLCYVKRTMRNFNEDNFVTGFKSIVIDEAFVLEGGVEKIIGTIRIKAHPVKLEQVSALFTAIGQDILKTDDWLVKYDELKENALFIDTTTNKYDTDLCAFNTQSEDWVKSNY